MPNRRVTVADSALLLAPAVLFFCRAAGMPSVGILCGVLLAVSLFWRRAWDFSEQHIFMVLAAALMLTVIGSRVFPPPEDRFSFLASMLYPEIVCPFLLYLAAFSTWFRRPEPALGMSAAAAFAVLAFCGEMQVFLLAGQLLPERVPAGGLLMQKLYPAAVILTVLVFFWELRRISRCGRVTRRELWVVLACVALGVTAWGIMLSSNFWGEKLLEMENWLFRNDQGTHFRPRTPMFFFNAQVNLAETLRPEWRERESEIALQVIGSHAPEYLRGRGFSIYRYGGSWEPGTPFPADLPERPGRSRSAAPVFLLQPEAGTAEYNWTILPKMVHSGDFIWYPESAAELELVSGVASRTVDGTIRVRHGALASGYRVRSFAVSRAGSSEVPDEKMRQVPYELAPVLREICYAEDILRPQPEREKISKLLYFFHTAFQYSLTPGNAEGDPVAHFLLHSRRGHCELCASAMVLLLRYCGIPARYVTGFICSESHCGGSIYVARIGNAHAWAEAYDREHRQWMRLDPTPELPTVAARDHEVLYQYWEGMSLYGSEILAALQRGHWAEAAGVVLDAVCSILTDRITIAAAGVLALLAAAVMTLRRYVRRRRHRKFDAAPERRPLIRRYQRFLWKMRFCGRIPWRSAPTVQEMLERLTAAPLRSPEKQTAALQFLRRYREERYRH